jgi:hypothetical protein
MPRIPKPTDVPSTTLDGSMSPAQIDIGVAAKIGQAGKAMGNAIEAIGGAFGELAGRVGAAQSDQAYADAQLETLKGRDAISEDVYGRVTEDDTTPYYETPEKHKGLNTDIEKRYFGSMTPKQQREFTQWRDRGDFTTLRAYREKAQGAEVKKFGRKTEGIVGTLTDRIASAPVGDIGSAWEQAKEVVEGHIKSTGSHLTAQEQIEARRQALGALGRAAFGKLIDANPSAAEELKVQIGEADWEDGEAAASKASAPAGSLGEVSARYESGGRGVGFISSGKGDPGGMSYGVHQLSGAYSMGAFLRSPEGAPYREKFGNSKPQSAAFNATYRQIAKEDPEGFAAAQKAFYARTHYEPVKAHAEKLGFNVNDRGVQEALFSMGVQHAGAKAIVSRAVAAAGKDPRAQISALYGERTNYVAALTSLPVSTKQSVLNRYRREINDALRLAGQSNGGPLSQVTAANEGQDIISGSEGVDQLGGGPVAAAKQLRLPKDDERLGAEMLDGMIQQGIVAPEQREPVLNILREEFKKNRKDPDWFDNLMGRFKEAGIDDTRLAEIDPEWFTNGADPTGREVSDEDLEAGQSREMVEGGAGGDELLTGEGGDQTVLEPAYGAGQTEDPAGNAPDEQAYGVGATKDPVDRQKDAARRFESFFTGKAKLKAGQVFSVEVGMGRKFTVTSDEINGMDRAELKKMFKASAERSKIQLAQQRAQVDDMMRRQEHESKFGRSAPDYNPDMVRSVLERQGPAGMKALEQHNIKMRRNAKAGEVLNGRWEIPNDQLDDRIADMSADDEYDTKLQEDVRREVERVKALRISDPAQAADRTQTVIAAQEEAKNLTGARKQATVFAARIEAQKQYNPGVSPENISVLTKSQARDMFRANPGLLERGSFQKFARELESAYGGEIADHMIRDIIKYNVRGAEDKEDATELVKNFFKDGVTTRDDMIRMRRMGQDNWNTSEFVPETKPGAAAEVGRQTQLRQRFIKEAEYNAVTNSGKRETRTQLKLNDKVIDILLRKADDPNVLKQFNDIYNNGKPGFAERIIKNLGRP